MKRYQMIGILIVLSVCSESTIAQVQVTPGVVTGIGIYDESQSYAGSSSASGLNAGFVAGAILDIALSPTVSFRPGLIFSGRGGSYTDSDSGYAGSPTENYNLNYLAIPIDFKWSYQAAPQFIPYALLGLNLGILLSATDHINIPGEGSGNIDVGSVYNPVDFGFDIGVGAEFPGSELIPFVELSYYLGLVNTSSDQPSGGSVTNSGIEIRVGLKFKPELINRVL
ncbi:MAG: outer membrane beta-barrel protein [Chitinispirillaceae bacterium]|jgi:hypothetical protein